jgi:phosphoribosyl 1,2-cyclic phosphodiesterase
LLRFASLASGSGGNCLIVEIGSTRILIDCGLKLTETERRLERLGVPPGEIDGILVTHEHGDHACGVFDFAAAHGVAVYLTYGTLRAMREEGKVTEGVRTVQLDGRQSLAVGDAQVHPFTVPHDAREPVQFVVSDGASRLGVMTDVGTPTAHVASCLSRCDALVLECNHDLDMLWAGGYPKWLKQRIAGPFGHLNNGDAERLLAGIDRSRLKHVIAAHLSQQNNRPQLAREALARAMGCEESWIGLATQDEGFAWRQA